MNTETALEHGGPATLLPEVTIVASSGCHFCADAESAIAEIAREHPLHVTRVRFTSPEGSGLIQQFGASMSPLVLLDGEYVSSGRLPRGRLRKLLAEKAAVRQPSTP
ncbi:MAG: thioredoxin family protein [Actinomycetota bacterium]|nr:thioredoxin family protein [Actinomycetota bacterium]